MPGQPTVSREFHVTWGIDVSTDDVATAREAAERVWQDTFGRALPAGYDDACVFEVTNPDGTTVTIDLAEEA